MLDSKQLTPPIMEHLRRLPYDKISSRRDFPRETKVKIYDTNCDGCGFCRVEVHLAKGIKVFDNVKYAINIVEIGEYKGIPEIKRTCSYPGNIEVINGVDVYPSLTEIIMNTCRLWSMNKHESSNEVIKEVRIEAEIEVSHRQIPEHGHNGEILHPEIVSE